MLAPQLYQGATDLGYHEEYYWGSAEAVTLPPNPQQAAAALAPNPGILDPARQVSEVPPAPNNVKTEPSSWTPGEGVRKAGRRPKSRTVFTQDQLWALHQCFQKQHYLTPLQVQQVSMALGLTAKQVKTWFQNRRMKLKRFHKEDGVWLDQASWITQVPTGADLMMTPSQGYPAPASCAQNTTTFTHSSSSTYNFLPQVNYNPFPSFSPGPASHSSPSYSQLLEFNPQAKQEQTSLFLSALPPHFSGPSITPSSRRKETFAFLGS
ncbi:homeobox protein NANOG [Microcaecilia unicolor]|uniref:Homeobox protein NANOG n=1 Tax=Microcaecilia unicolor TaxID=1415580 RepID=A0A6P7WXW4_9AMPH|nr:homeobox protein NANOG [Microcaecilia unicolor]